MLNLLALNQQKRKFSYLRKDNACRHRNSGWITECNDEKGHQDKIHKQNKAYHGHNQWKMLDSKGHIKQESNGDKENAHKDMPKRNNLSNQLMTVVGIGKHKTSKEGPNRQGKTQSFTDPRGAKTNDDCR